MKSSRNSFSNLLGLSVLALVFSSSLGFAQGFKQIHQCGGSDKQPNTLIQNPADGFFYGTSRGGGTGYGSVFKMDTSGNVTTIYSFAGPPGDGRYPSAGLFLNSDSLLYGTTYLGGVDDAGTVFKMDTSGGSYAFHSQPAPSGACQMTGTAPEASLFKANDGSLYVPMTNCGGAGEYGTIDRVSTSLGETEIAGFHVLTDEFISPMGHLLQGSDNNLYGTATENSVKGQSSHGGIYRVGLGGGAIDFVHNFANGEGIYTSVSNPLFLANDGHFYGTTEEGTNPDGSGQPCGTIFKMGTDGTFQNLHLFTGPDGCAPYAGVVQASDGYLYGTTSTGGKSTAGVIYRVDLSGNYTLLFDLADTGASGACQPYTELVQGVDGKLYGTTGCGGIGSIYTIDPTQTIAGLTPNSGPAAGGTSVTVGGTGFVPGASVTFAGISGTGVSVPDSMHIDATTQAIGSPGTIGNAAVTLPDTTVIILYNGWFYDFLDVPTGDIFHDYVRKILSHGITAGCGGGNYCRNNPVRRDQMAVFLLKAEHGSGYTPPSCTGVFPDVPCPGPFTDWIEALAAEGITGGCGGGNYCPGNPVTRQQMAVFLLKTEHGSSYVPPACTGIFPDVPCPSAFADWIEQIFHEGITGGCGGGNYCPFNPNTRGQMAVFITKTFTLQ